MNIRQVSQNRRALLLCSTSIVMCCGLFGGVTAPCSYADTLPQGGRVVGGQASIDYQSDNLLHIYQNTERSIIEWQSFNIGETARTEFFQPNSSSIVVNRVVGGGVDPTRILGQMTANGQVVVLDPNGVFFGSNSIIDTAGLIASSASTFDAATFMDSGRLNLSDISGGQIVNDGHITVQDAGLAAFVAPTVINNGIITARLGEVDLASGSRATIDLYGDGLLELALDEGGKQRVINNGIIDAASGIVRLQAAAAKDVVDNIVSNSGVIRANAVAENAAGEIVLYADGANVVDTTGQSMAINNGYLDASASETVGHGGKVYVLGGYVGLGNHSVINASGVNGGGEVYIGGDYLGQGSLPTSIYTYVAEDSFIFNDAYLSGRGGKTIVWADDTTWFYGSIYGRGGIYGGDGGFVETSGKVNLLAKGFVDLSATEGNKGTYLLDPADITIYGNVDDSFVSTDGTVDLSADKVLRLSAIQEAIEKSDFFMGTQTPLRSFNGFASVDDADILPTASVIMTVDVNIPENPSGVIYEQGGSGYGTYVGFQSDGTLVFHAGKGSSFNASEAAHLELAAGASNIPTGSGTLSWEIDLSGGHISAYWNGTLLGTASAGGSISKWSGGDTGGVGQATNSIVSGANSANFNGSFDGALKYYEYNSGFLADESGQGNSAVIGAGAPGIVENIINGHDVIRLNDADRLLIADTDDINTASQNEISRSFTFRTDSNVNTEQLLYKEGGGTNGYVVYVESGKLNVGLYNSGGTALAYHQYDVSGDTDYHLTSVFDANSNSFVTRLNGKVISGVGLGGGVALAGHSGDIVFGRNDTTIIDETGGAINPNQTVSTLAEAIFYNTALSDAEQQLMEQYSAEKYGVGLYGTGTGSNDAERAMAADGYSAFSVGYLEHLSETADIVLRAQDTITLDLQGDVLNLVDDRNITLQTVDGSITDISSGEIVTRQVTNGGHITMTAGGNILLDQTELTTLDGGVVNLAADGDVNVMMQDTINLGRVEGENIFVQTRNGDADIVVNDHVNAQGNGNSLVFVTGNRFINQLGVSDTLSAANGRFLVYSHEPAEDNRGGHSYDFKRYDANYTGYAPAGVVQAGSGFIYDVAPTLTITAEDAEMYKGGQFPKLTYTASGFIDGDDYFDLNVQPKLSVNANQFSDVGEYAITPFGAEGMNYKFIYEVAMLDVLNPPVNFSRIGAVMAKPTVPFLPSLRKNGGAAASMMTSAKARENVDQEDGGVYVRDIEPSAGMNSTGAQCMVQGSDLSCMIF